MRWLLMVLVFCAAPARAVTCEDATYQGHSFTACTVDATTESLHLFHKGDNGAVLGSFRGIEAVLGDKSLLFAMNAGMYHDDRSPVGHYVEDGVETMRVIPNAGPGNFGLLPNGVLCINDDRADVFETLQFLRDEPICRDATQSGPMLVIDGALHPRFLPDSTSHYIRNGVGTTNDGTRAVFVISNDRVSFYTFGRFFRDYLGLPNALYFDGNVSRLHAPMMDRSDTGRQLGPMVGVIR